MKKIILREEAKEKIRQKVTIIPNLNFEKQRSG